jgi:ubiquitin-like-conjugating enzyme ATG3
MKRFIERMDRGVRELQQKEKQQQQHQQQGSGSSQEGAGETASGSGKREKSRWFGKSSTSSKKEKASEEGEELVEGLRVDQYLVVFLKFMSSIGKAFSTVASRY